MNEVGRYAKIPQVVEAVRWPCDPAVLNEWIGPEAHWHHVTPERSAGWDDYTWTRDSGFASQYPGCIAVFCHPDSTWKVIPEGHWVIKGPAADGDFYPCAPEVFEETFVPFRVTVDIEAEASGD